MVRFTLTIGDEERAAMQEIALNTETMRKQRKSFRILFGVLCAFLFILLILSPDPVEFAVIFAVILCATGGLPAYQRYLIQQNMKKADPHMTTGERSYEIDEAGIQITTPLGTGKNSWDAFTEYGTQSHYIWVKRVDNQMVLLDSDRLSAEETEELRDYLGKLKKE